MISELNKTEQLSENSEEISIASCVCGQLSISLKGPPTRVSVCHCFACQQRTGSVMGVQARYLKSQIVNEQGQYTNFTRIGDEGSHIDYHFCPHCGSTVSYTFRDYIVDSIIIPVGSLKNPNIGTPVFSVYEARKHSWVVLPENIEHMD